MITKIANHIQQFFQLIILGKNKCDLTIMASEDLLAEDVKAVLLHEFAKKYEDATHAPKWKDNVLLIKMSNGILYQLTFTPSVKKHNSHLISISASYKTIILTLLLLISTGYIIFYFNVIGLISILSGLIIIWFTSIMWLFLKVNKLKNKLHTILNYVYETTYLKEYYDFLDKDRLARGHKGIHEHPSSEKYRLK